LNRAAVLLLMEHNFYHIWPLCGLLEYRIKSIPYFAP